MRQARVPDVPWESNGGCFHGSINSAHNTRIICIRLLRSVMSQYWQPRILLVWVSSFSIVLRIEGELGFQRSAMLLEGHRRFNADLSIFQERKRCVVLSSIRVLIC